MLDHDISSHLGPDVPDTTPPDISGCPTSPIQVTTSPGSTTARAFWQEPTATDNSGDIPTRTSTHTPGSFFPIGPTQVTYRFFDSSANIATCTFTVIVTRK